MNSITYMDYYIPEKELTISSFLEGIEVNWIPACFNDREEYRLFIENVLELKSIRIEEELGPAEMIGMLIEKMFETQPIDPEDIDIIILARENADNGGLNLSSYLQYRYHMKNAFIMNVSGNQCIDMEVALCLTSSLFESRRDISNILLVGAVKPKNLKKRIVGAYAIMGDAAGIVLTRKNQKGTRLIDHTIRSNGRFYKGFPTSPGPGGDAIIQYTESYFNCLSHLLETHSLADRDIEKIIIQNANPLIVSQFIPRLGLNSNKIFADNLGRYGHLNQLDFLVNLKALSQMPALDKNKYILSVGSGWYGTFISSLYSLPGE